LRVVLVAKQIAENPDLGAPRLDLGRPEIAQQLQMVAVVLRPLAPRVKTRVARGGIDGPHSLAAAPIGALEAGCQIVEAEVSERQLEQPVAHGAKLLAERRDPPRQGAVVGKLRAACHQRPAHTHKPSPVDLVGKPHLQARISRASASRSAERTFAASRTAPFSRR
jgi:hypothetical protein